ncbi:MAG TPA: glycosyltransferase [Thermoanaerobaculia bacterium]|nr:glycosyltransferase [Thermoanaerobaculia bacterium]
MKLAILGTRGVPPRYGGFETFAAELGRRLIARGHDVTVYCRDYGARASRPQSPAVPAGDSSSSETLADCGRDARAPLTTWEGIHRIVLPSIGHKYFETVSHSFFSAIDALRRDFDAILICNAANAFVLPLLRAARMKVAINVDGIERKRRKWNVLGRAVYVIGESFSAAFATVVADADVIADYYRKNYAIDPVVIPYGSEFPPEEDSDIRRRLGVDQYVLYVSRFEPENNPLEVVEAYERVATNIPLVMLGEARYDKHLAAQLRNHASPKILFPGALYGPDYRTLQRHALLYIQATEVGGTHPALIEAMASNGCVLAHDTPENREVGGDAVGYFTLRPIETLSGTISEWLASPNLRQTQIERARRRAAERYGWDAVTAAYEALFLA